MNRWDAPYGSFDVEVGEYGVSSVRTSDGGESAPVDGDLATALNEHVHGRPSSLQLNLQGLRPLAQVTLAKLLEIPHGEVRSYAWVAREIGRPAATRSVASAVANNPIPVLIPCHRVVRSDGHVGEYSFGGEPVKREMLRFEGVDLDRLDLLASRNVRVLGDPETEQFHLPSCALVASNWKATEFTNSEGAHSAHLQPCSRCRP